MEAIEIEELDPLAQALVDSQNQQIVHLGNQINVFTERRNIYGK